MSKPIDPGSIVIAFVTLCLFIAALFVKGLSHDLFLEAGVFLVSVKIIIMTYRNGVSVGRMDRKLDVILEKLSEKSGGNGMREDLSQNRSGQT
jgi:hypothetical protein